MKQAIAIAVAAIAGLAMFKALIGALETRLVFFPSAGEDRTPASLGIAYEAVRIRTSDGERLLAWQLEPTDAIADVVYFHGNGGNLSVWLPVFAALHAHRLRVLAVDYRGYGLSSGRPSEEGVYRDAEAVVQHATAGQPKSARRPLVFWGRSLGGPIAAAATRVVRPDGLILESSFADKAAVVRSHPVLRMLNVFGAYRFETVKLLTDFSGPVLVIHGSRDSVVPFALGRELHGLLNAPKRFVEIAGADHNDLIDASRSDYWTPVLEFVAGLRPSG
ncbi:MAG: alpha/beta hydrolase [Vicinamibacterales bacterium]